MMSHVSGIVQHHTFLCPPISPLSTSPSSLPLLSHLVRPSIGVALCSRSSRSLPRSRFAMAIPKDPAALKDYIVAACAAYKAAPSKGDDHRRSLSVGNAYFVKFGNPKILESEVAVRNCIADHGKAHPEKPGRARIPKLLFSFRRESTAYVVMEYVPLAASPPNPEKVAAMLAWLQGIPLPSGTPVGRLAGGYIRHSFFNDNEAPLAFSSVDAIQRYVNKGYETLSKQAQLTTTPVNLGADRLVLVHPGTGIPVPAGVDTSGDIVLMDLGDFNVLPESFAKSPGSSNNGNAASIAKIRAVLWMISDPELGLDDDGHPKKPNGGVRDI